MTCAHCRRERHELMKTQADAAKIAEQDREYRAALKRRKMRVCTIQMANGLTMIGEVPDSVAGFMPRRLFVRRPDRTAFMWIELIDSDSEIPLYREDPA